MTACRQYESWDSERRLQASTHSMKWKTYAHFGITAHSLVNVREKENKINASRHAYDREIGLRRFEGRANDNGVSAAKCQEFCDSDGGQHMFECQKERERGEGFRKVPKKKNIWLWQGMRSNGTKEGEKHTAADVRLWQIGAVTSINTSWYKMEEDQEVKQSWESAGKWHFPFFRHILCFDASTISSSLLGATRPDNSGLIRLFPCSPLFFTIAPSSTAILPISSFFSENMKLLFGRNKGHGQRERWPPWLERTNKNSVVFFLLSNEKTRESGKQDKKIRLCVIVRDNDLRGDATPQIAEKCN